MLHDPRHPYTVGLLRCIPRGGVRKDHGRLDTIPGFLPSLGAELPGLRLRRPLRARRGALPHRGAAARRRSAAATRAAATSTSGRRRCRARWPPTLALPRDRPRADAAARGSTISARCSSSTGTTSTRSSASALGDLAGRDARARRRVGQRQDDARADAARDRRSPTTGARRARRARARAALPEARRARTCARSRSSSRIPTRRSTGVTRCGGSCAAR